ncbi:hypothetical protein BDF14DRAFT_1996116 [Spinellus fusiger]|nr:hypothetical protein BDF14DRAFT_1996116 [Spinellus fusiger]
MAALDSDLSVLSFVVVEQGEQKIHGLTDLKSTKKKVYNKASKIQRLTAHLTLQSKKQK